MICSTPAVIRGLRIYDMDKMTFLPWDLDPYAQFRWDRKEPNALFSWDHMGKTTQEGERPFLRGFCLDFNGPS